MRGARSSGSSTEGGRGEFENTWITAAGERRRVAWSTTPLRDDRATRASSSAAWTSPSASATRTSCGARAPASSRRATSSGAGSSGTSTTARSSGSSRSRSCSASRRRASASDPEQAEQLLGQASEELAQALEELRELARGIHPAVLTDRGLGRRARGARSRGRRSRSTSSSLDERLPGAGRGGGVLRRLRGARERRQVRGGVLGRR